MKLFMCQACGQALFFENTHCERSGHRLGYLPEHTELTALDQVDGERWRPLAAPDELVKFCLNAAYHACNWLIPADSADVFCAACRLNRTIPEVDEPGHLLLWQRLEAAKHRMVYGLLRLGLPIVSKMDDPVTGLCFDFLTDSGSAFQAEATPVLTGHARGVITIDIDEADDVERERQRQSLSESYRTLLGHFRHEVGHYYWERLVFESVWQEAFREMFGDERSDYAAALAKNYEHGPVPDWQQRHVSSYASVHPWEDFAETWAHYLHIVDTIGTAHAFGLETHLGVGINPELDLAIDFDAYDQPDFDSLIAVWLPLTYAVNSLNQSMGQPALYPFVLSPVAIGKLRFVHGLIYGAEVATR